MEAEACTCYSDLMLEFDFLNLFLPLHSRHSYLLPRRLTSVRDSATAHVKRPSHTHYRFTSLDARATVSSEPQPLPE